MTTFPDILDLTVPQLLERHATKRPSMIALSARSAEGWRDRLSYAQLVQRMEGMAAGLAAEGLKQGDRVAIFLDNWAGREAILTSLGAFRLGAVACPLNTRYADEELQYALALIDPTLIVAQGTDAARLRQLCATARLLLVGAAKSTVDTSNATVWPQPQDFIAPVLPAAPRSNEILSSLLFTSGTTAKPKAVMHSQRSMIGAGLCCGTALGLRPGDLYHGGYPFFTSSGLNLGCASAWAMGGGLVFEEPLDNAGRLNLIAQEKSTFYHGVPSVVQFLVDEYARGTYDVSSLRRVGYGGSAMPRKVIERIAHHWPHVEQVQIYGMTESGPSGTVLAPEFTLSKIGSVGKAMDYCGLRIVDSVGRDLPAGEDGEIVLTGPAIAQGYFRNPEATKTAFDCGGIRTGDVGHIDDDGYLFFTDRLKDIINRGGLKISSVAVEDVLYRHEAVREAAVVAIAHESLGEDIGAYVVPAAGHEIDIEDLAAFCARYLADYQRPRHWYILKELPKNPMGKILKADLRNLTSTFSGVR